MTKLEQSIVDEYKFCVHQAQRGYQPDLERLLDKIALNQFYCKIDKADIIASKLINYSYDVH